MSKIAQIKQSITYPLFNFFKIRKMILNDPNVINSKKIDNYVTAYTFFLIPMLISYVLPKAGIAILSFFLSDRIPSDESNLIYNFLINFQPKEEDKINVFNFFDINLSTLVSASLIFLFPISYGYFVKLNTNNPGKNELNASKFFLYISTSLFFPFTIFMSLLPLFLSLFIFFPSQALPALSDLNFFLPLVVFLSCLIIPIYVIRIIIKTECSVRSQFNLDKYKFSSFLMASYYYLVPFLFLYFLLFITYWLKTSPL